MLVHEIKSDLRVCHMIDFCQNMRSGVGRYVVQIVKVLLHGASEDSFTHFHV